MFAALGGLMEPVMDWAEALTRYYGDLRDTK